LLGAVLGAAVDANQAKHGHNSGGLGMIAGGVGANLLNAKFSRDQEREADQLGATAMAKAGYNPSTAPSFWRLMATQGGGGNGTWMDSHPSSSEREQTLAALAVQLGPIYAANSRPENSKQYATASPTTSYGNDGFPRSSYVSLDSTAAEISADSPYARGRAAFKEKRFDDALPLFRDAADTGDERAITMLAAYAQNGWGRPVDQAEAKQLLQQAAQKGLGRAMTLLGDYSVRGFAGPKDEGEALKWWMLGANRGDGRAQANLAFAHLNGMGGTEKNVRLARQYAEQAAASGDPLGRALLGTMTRDGLGGPANPQQGFLMINEVVDQIAWARYQVGLSYERGLGVEADRSRAIAAYQIAAQAGVTAAQSRLAALNK
jgi:TPR repeat protein